MQKKKKKTALWPITVKENPRPIHIAHKAAPCHVTPIVVTSAQSSQTLSYNAATKKAQ